MAVRRSWLRIAASALAAAIGIVLLMKVFSQPVLAISTLLCVAPGGTGCDVSTCGGTCYGSVQDAVDAAAPGDEIHVATGEYLGVQARGGMTQVVYISKTVTIRGGYSSDLTARDKDLYPSTLDAQGQGRVISIIEAGAATVDALNITGGNAHGMTAYCSTAGGPSDGCGGGIFVVNSPANILGNTVSNNVAGVSAGGHSANGGGIYLAYGYGAVIAENVVISNVASLGERGMGGGIDIEAAHDFSVAGNLVLENHATAHESLVGWGGGIAIHGSGSTGVIEGNWIEGNRTNGEGGESGAGIYQWYGSVQYIRNHVVGNQGDPAVYLGHADSQFNMNRVVGNNPLTGINLVNGGYDELTLVNNIIATENGGDPLWASAYEGAPLRARLIHNTLVGSGAGNGVFVGTAYVTLSLTNTIVVNNSWGITNTAPASSTIYVDRTLFWGNGNDGIRGADPVDGDPAFANPGAGNYHLSGSSAAIDAAVEAGVGNDIDDDPRPLGSGPDIGADEARLLFVPLVLRGT